MATTALCPLYRATRSLSLSRFQVGLMGGGIFLLCGVLARIEGVLTYATIYWMGAGQNAAGVSQFLLASFLLRWMVYLIWSMLYFMITFWIETQARHIRAVRAEAAACAIELQLLKAQVNPHFLFNALNSIKALIGDEERAQPLIQAFADYLRFSLDQQRDMQPLGVELEALESYLNVERVRFGQRLDCSIKACAVARATIAPVTLVQPLLENAVKYGQRSSALPLRIRILAELEGSNLVVSVFNTGSWTNPDHRESTGLGIESLRRRLELLYGNAAELQVAPVFGGVEAVVRIPSATQEKLIA